MNTKDNILKQIFFDENHNWDNFVKLHPKSIREIVLEEVEKFCFCGEKEAGFSLYACEYCGEIKIVPHRCKGKPKRTILMEYLAEIRYEKIYLNNEILLLADKYIEQGIIPGKYRDDALHISAATVFDCNVVVSWNFKHMVKLKTILGVNGINKLIRVSTLFYVWQSILCCGLMLKRDELSFSKQLGEGFPIV